jgi:hypothetical protein
MSGEWYRISSSLFQQCHPPSIRSICHPPSTAEFRGLLFALLGFITLIGGPDFCPIDPRECLDIFDVAILLLSS